MTSTLNKTPVDAELVPTLLNGQRAVILSCPIAGGLAIGDIIDICADMQATNVLPRSGNSNNVLFGTQLILASAAGNVTGIALNYGQGVNITPTMHHYGVTRATCYVSSGLHIAGQTFVNLVAWCASDFVKANALALTIDKGYGQITVRKTLAGT